MPRSVSSADKYCYLDLDLNHQRSQLARTAAFCHATNTRYGLSSSDLRHLGGSELQRLPMFMENDHEWSANSKNVVTQPPAYGHRLIVRLFWGVAPMACENFATLCSQMDATKAPLGQSGKPLTYSGSKIHRVIPGFIMQGGDFVFGNGSGGESIWGKKFKDERAGLQLSHSRRGVLSMGNSGKNSNTSQFFLTFDAAPQCNGKHVVIGELISGWEVLSAVEQVGTSSGEPSVPIQITACGLWIPWKMPAAGYWFDRPDPDSYSGITSEFMVRPRVGLVVPNETARDKFRQALTPQCVIVINPEESCSSNGVEGTRKLLEDFSIDVVVVAPACTDQVASMELPSAWKHLPREQVILTAKPVQALPAVQRQSWMRQQAQWQLDGVY